MKFSSVNFGFIGTYKKGLMGFLKTSNSQCHTNKLEIKLLQLSFMDGSFLYFASYVICNRDNMLGQEVHRRDHRYGQMLTMANGTKIC